MQIRDSLWFDPTMIFLGGQWRAPEGGGRIAVENPSTGEIIGHIGHATKSDVDDAVQSAEIALSGDWGRMPAAERGRMLMRMSQIVLERAEELAFIESTDVGKPMKQARNDSVALARYLEFYGGAADKLHGTTIPYQDGFTVYTLREPHGVTAHIIPWNYPMQILGRSVGAALAAGNACVLKPAEDASLSSLAFAAIAEEAGLPAGALNVVTGLGSDVGAALSSHRGVHHVSFTGSVTTGRLIQEAAAQSVVPVTLELGGKSPHIVFDDVDLQPALPVLVGACMQAAGQTCSAASRVLVQRGIYDEVRTRMAEIAGLTVGPAQVIRLGPLASVSVRIVSDISSEGGWSSPWLPKGVSRMTPPRAGITSPGSVRRCGAGSRARGRKSLARCRFSYYSRMRKKRCASPMARNTGSSPGCGHAMAGGRCAWRTAECRAGFINNYGAGRVELPFGGTGKSATGAKGVRGAIRLHAAQDRRRITADPVRGAGAVLILPLDALANCAHGITRPAGLHVAVGPSSR